MARTGKYTEIRFGMLFWKMYCSKCGTRLRRQQIKAIINKGDEDFSSYLPGQGYVIGMKRLIKKTYNYKCPQCGKQTMYDEQLRIARRQKILGKKIISPPEEEE